MDVIKRLNDLRLQRNLSVYRLAELSGINQSTLANTFSRGTVPSLKNLECLCEAMGITLSQFFSDEHEFKVLTSKECQLVDNYRKLNENMKTTLLEMVIQIAENKE